MHIELETSSTLIAIFIFSLISVTCSTFTIIIYLRMKNLRTLVYRFFLHVAFNEWLSRISYLILFILIENIIFMLFVLVQLLSISQILILYYLLLSYVLVCIN